MAGENIPQQLPETLKPLGELALDLRWTWSHAGDAVWRCIDPDTYDSTQNPWIVLQNVSSLRLAQLAKDASFLSDFHEIAREREKYLSTSKWYQEAHPDGLKGPVAYFCMEFGLGEALPLYAGGLGVLAGDYLKTASDLGAPTVGVGLLYQEGYFRQMLDAEGRQLEFYPYNDPASLPISPARNPSGEWLRVDVELPGRKLVLRVWEARVGLVTLYLLDSNDPMNSPVDRGITGELYGGDAEMRLLQEIALGIGGWRALAALGVTPSVLHMNEGHSAFATLERARSLMGERGMSFDDALWASRAANLFTTHTPAKAGFDEFDTALISQYFRDYANALGISIERLLDLGRAQPGNHNGVFNMAYLALRACGAANGVSELHGQVSRRLFRVLYPRWPEGEIPVGHVTNGVHTPSWDSVGADELWTQACGKERWLGDMESHRKKIEALPDERLWKLRMEGRLKLVDYVRRRLASQVSLQGADAETVERALGVLDPNTLTVGFARRFTAYKRPNLILRDADRLIRIFANPLRPVQLVVAGKAHPRDEEGKEMVRSMVQFARRPEARNRVVFLADHDMALTEQLVQGVDLWINMPRRPWEACGTSGMKTLVNGGLNISELDGWWAEAYSPELGWAIGDGREHPEPEWDAAEADEFYSLLENEIAPMFYDRDDNGVPRGWVARIRSSMAGLVARFSANRMVREYVENYYIPMAESYQSRLEGGPELARSVSDWRHALKLHWANVRFLEVNVKPGGDGHDFQAHVCLGDLSASDVKVEIYADPLNGRPSFRAPMRRICALPGAVHGYIYETVAPADRPAEHYTPRIVPSHPYVSCPLEEERVIWSR